MHYLSHTSHVVLISGLYESEQIWHPIRRHLQQFGLSDSSISHYSLTDFQFTDRCSSIELRTLAITPPTTQAGMRTVLFGPPLGAIIALLWSASWPVDGLALISPIFNVRQNLVSTLRGNIPLRHNTAVIDLLAMKTEQFARALDSSAATRISIFTGNLDVLAWFGTRNWRLREIAESRKPRINHRSLGIVGHYGHLFRANFLSKAIIRSLYETDEIA